MCPGYTYAKAGVDIGKVAKIHRNIDRILTATYRARRGKVGEVLGVRQHYAGLVDIGGEFALAIHTDNVGTKPIIAEAVGKYDTVGVDCVAMNVNDVICLGAEPIALSNYIALDRPRPKLVAELMKGIRRGATQAGVAVVAGETAILPGLINGFDLSAAVVGIVRKDKIITGENTRVGDVVLGLPSNGIHSNGLTLARKLLLSRRVNIRIARELLRPTRIYVKPILKLLSAGIEIHGLAHITGGAYSKLKRIGERAKVGFRLDHFPDSPSIFKMIQAKGHVSDREMFRTFNMGVGLVVVCPRRVAARGKAILPGCKVIGHITDSKAVTVDLDNREIEIESY